MKGTFRAAAIVIGLGALTALSACSPATDPTTTSPLTAAPSPTSTRTSVEPLPVAEQLPGLKTLTELGPTTGSKIVGRIQVKPGELWLNVTCRGGGELVVAFEPMDRFSVPCSDVAQPNRNQINLARPHELKITVTAAKDVEWSLRAQQ